MEIKDIQINGPALARLREAALSYRGYVLALNALEDQGDDNVDQWETRADIEASLAGVVDEVFTFTQDELVEAACSAGIDGDITGEQIEAYVRQEAQ